MITRQYSLNQMPGYPFERDYNIEKIAFFDIETTGFAAEETYLYLIGCAYYKDSSFHLIQWFSEGIQEEALLLTSFFEFLKSYDYLIHYNGSGFDLPYLQRKCNQLKLNYSFDLIKSIDLYKRILPYKKIFKLNSLKLKSLEDFLHIRRKDTFSGGDLIEVYSSYLGKKHLETLRNKREPEMTSSIPSEADILLKQLLLHNEEDIKGLLSISPILQYVDLFEKPLRIIKTETEQDMFLITLETSVILPVPISYGNELVHLETFENSVLLTVRIFEGELKYFYDNYKDYYYLPAEDYAVHKSVASFVDKKYKVKAKPSTCYIRKQGLFVPQYTPVISPYLKNSHQDKLTFLEVHTDFLLQEDKLEQYVRHLLEHLIR